MQEFKKKTKKKHGFGTATLIISNEKMNDNKSIHQNNNFGVEHVPKEIKEFVGN